MTISPILYRTKIKIFRQGWSERLEIMKKTLPNGNKLVADINKMKNLPCFSCEKTEMLIGFSVVGLAKNTPWILNLRNLRKIRSDSEIRPTLDL